MVKDVSIIIGANYGDEGKGRMSDYLANKAIQAGQSTITILSNGGAQRGHTVVLDNGFTHIFHHFGSGTLAGADTYLPQSFICNPIVFEREYMDLKVLYFKDKKMPKIFVYPDCKVSTPFDMMNNQIIEEERQKNERKHGSCGMGIWETILRNREYDISLQEMMVMTNERLFTYLKWLRDNYSQKRLLAKGVKNLTGWKTIYFNDNLIHNYIKDFRNFVKHIEIIGVSEGAKYKNVLNDYDHIIFENGQGLLIDEDSDPVYSTPSHTGLYEPINFLNHSKYTFGFDNFNINVYYISRSYYTRHGNGNLTAEVDASFINGLKMDTETNQFNQSQGKFRYGLITPDMFDVITAINKDIFKNEKILNNLDELHTNLVITHCDEKDIYPIIDKDTKVYKVYGPKRNDKVEVVNDYRGV